MGDYNFGDVFKWIFYLGILGRVGGGIVIACAYCVCICLGAYIYHRNAPDSASSLNISNTEITIQTEDTSTKKGSLTGDNTEVFEGVSLSPEVCKFQK